MIAGCNPGDVAIVAQPAEIHTFVALEEGTYSITVVGGHYKSGTTSSRTKDLRGRKPKS